MNVPWHEIVSIGLIVGEYLIKIWAIGAIPENRNPSSSSAWLLLILLIPGLGLPLYLLIGSPYVTGQRLKVQQQATHVLAHYARDIPTVPDGVEIADDLASIAQLNRTLTSEPMVMGRIHHLLGDARQTVTWLTEAVDRAENDVNVEFYIAAWDDVTDPFFQALGRAVQRGVKVRMLFDQLGSRAYPGFGRFKRRLTQIGVEWHMMMPLNLLRGQFRRPDLRNHRKLVIIDHREGFLGSMNLIDPSYLKAKNIKIGREWVDLNVTLTGDVVEQLSGVFALDWFQETGEIMDPVDLPTVPGPAMQLVPSGPGFTTEPNLRLFCSLMAHATRRLEIVSPYFVPDTSLLQMITTASLRGVDVELFVSEKADQFMVNHAQRSYYTALLEAGVRIWRYPAPAILHSKFLIVDGEVSVIGSSNMDMRSFFLDYEVSLFVIDTAFAAELQSTAETYRSISCELTLDEWRRQPWHQRYLDSVMRLTAAVQ